MFDFKAAPCHPSSLSPHFQSCCRAPALSLSPSLIHTHKERVLKKGPAAGGRRASGFLDARCCSDKARVCVSRGVMQFHRSFLSGQITGLEPLLCFTSHTPSAPWQRAATMLGSDRKSSSSRFSFLAAGLSSNTTVSFSSVES